MVLAPPVEEMMKGDTWNIPWGKVLTEPSWAHHRATGERSHQAAKFEGSSDDKMSFPPPSCIQSLFCQQHELSFPLIFMNSHSTCVFTVKSVQKPINKLLGGTKRSCVTWCEEATFREFAQHLQAQRTRILTKESDPSPKPALKSLKSKPCLSIGPSQGQV